MAKLPLPQILRGLRGREQAKPQERGERLRDRASAGPGSLAAFSISAGSLSRPCPSQGSVLPGLSGAGPA